MDQYPTTIEIRRRLIGWKLFVTMRIEDANDLAVNLDRVGNPDAAVERVVDALGNCGLSRTRQTS